MDYSKHLYIGSLGEELVERDMIGPIPHSSRRREVVLHKKIQELARTDLKFTF